MSFYECPKCGGIPGVTFCCTSIDKKKESKVTMPEPVAWVRRHPDGALTAEFLEDAVISTVRKKSGAWLPMTTTNQAEAYADAKVREALEEAAALCDRFSERDMHPEECADAIRALIPKEPA